jgi:hypothetical protein
MFPPVSETDQRTEPLFTEIRRAEKAMSVRLYWLTEPRTIPSTWSRVSQLLKAGRRARG